MDEIQLRMQVGDVGLVADAIQRDIAATPAEQDTTELARILAWLRYRIARANSVAAQVTES
jgi:hypothetical protein